jgi:hypothetical protein
MALNLGSQHDLTVHVVTGARCWSACKEAGAWKSALMKALSHDLDILILRVTLLDTARSTHPLWPGPALLGTNLITAQVATVVRFNMYSAYTLKLSDHIALAAPARRPHKHLPTALAYASYR